MLLKSNYVLLVSSLSLPPNALESIATTSGMWERFSQSGELSLIHYSIINGPAGQDFFSIGRVMLDQRILATAKGQPIDQSRHTLYTEIKAVTYHQLKVQKIEHGWIARVIFDV